MEPNWANLDALVLSLILDSFEEWIDHISFRMVCKSWRSVVKLHHHLKSNAVPMLMIQTERETNLYSIPGSRTYSFQSSEIPMGRDMWCYGVFHNGWFATSNSDSIVLQNPFKNVAPIHFPPPVNESVYRIALSSDPITSANDYVVAAIDTHHRISFIRAGQKHWSLVKTDEDCFYTSITFYKGLIYAVVEKSNEFSIVSFNPSSKDKIVPNMVLQGQGRHDHHDNDVTSNYLVESLEGDFWVVREFYNEKDSIYHLPSNYFHVYKLEQNGKLVRLKSLGDNVLFVDDLVSFSVSASCFSNCLEKDSIYHLPNIHSSEKMTANFMTYNIKEESSRRHCCGGTPAAKEGSFTCNWVQPSFQWD